MITLEAPYTINEQGILETTETFTRFFQPSNHLANIDISSFTPTIRGLDRLITQAEQIKADAKDIVMLGHMIRPHIIDERLYLTVGDTLMGVTNWAFGQLCMKLGIPSEYAKSMLKHKKFDLFTHTVEEWMDTKLQEDVWLVRTYQNAIRGILSSQYCSFDINKVLPTLQRSLGESGGKYIVDRGFVNPEKAVIRIVSDEVINVVGDPHFMGIRLLSSDVGQHSVTIEFFVYRYRCSNGMLFGKKDGILFRRRHTTKEIVSERDMIVAVNDMLAGLPQLKTMVKTRLEEAHAKPLSKDDLERLIDKFRLSTHVGKKNTEEFFGGIEEDMQRYGGSNLFSFANVLTERAQKMSWQKGETLESFAGSLIFN